MTIENRKTGKRQRISPTDWDFFKQKKLETGHPSQTYASLFKVIDLDDSSPLDEVESGESNVPEVLKTFNTNPAKSDGETRKKITPGQEQ